MGLFSKITAGIGTILGGPVGGIIGDVAGGLIEGRATGAAADAFAAGAEDARRTLTAAGTANVDRFAPFTEVGATGAGGLNALLTDPESFRGSPGSQFRLTEGLDELDRRFSAGGFLNSGRRVKALETFRQNIAAGEFQSEFQRLLATAGLGVSAATGLSSLNTALARDTAGIEAGVGTARAGAEIGKGDILGRTVGSIFERGSNLLNKSKQNLNDLLVNTAQRPSPVF